MKLKAFFMMAILALCSVACSNNDDLPAVIDLSGNYTGYTDADCTHFQDRYTNQESLSITTNENETLSVSFKSATWGLFHVAEATILNKGDKYILNGKGTVTMGMGNTSKPYDFTMTGTCNTTKDNYSFSFQIPAVMGGLTITLLPGEAPKQTTK